nr:hypothetical protein [Geminicoccus flavidas]
MFAGFGQRSIQHLGELGGRFGAVRQADQVAASLDAEQVDDIRGRGATGRHVLQDVVERAHLARAVGDLDPKVVDDGRSFLGRVQQPTDRGSQGRAGHLGLHAALSQAGERHQHLVEALAGATRDRPDLQHRLPKLVDVGLRRGADGHELVDDLRCLVRVEPELAHRVRDDLRGTIERDHLGAGEVDDLAGHLDGRVGVVAGLRQHLKAVGDLRGREARALP